ncbi:hypothetical protein B0H34DRAFT_535864 [Crassisporium funariophilum]|nr:hypothetical protein B0H34DRAFT_535864 [Crassisporium funariophilum]
MAVTLDVALAVSVWVEALIYGVYASLFFEALFIMVKKKSPWVVSAKVFMGGTIAMFVLATAHMVVNLYRFLRGFVLDIDPLGPAVYLLDFSRWDNLAHSAMLCIMTWLGDAMIYRCFVIWDRQLWVTVIPVILLILSISSNAALFFWFTHPGSQSPQEVMSWLGTVYPFAFAQNTITTGMIAFKIWRQHRASVTLGVAQHSPLDLLGIMRIIVESAMIYTFELLVLIILYPLGSNAQFIVQSAVIPSIGIVFVLIAIRVHFSRSRSLFGETVMAAMPTWLDDGSSFDARSDQSSQNPVGVEANDVVEEKKSEDLFLSLVARPLPRMTRERTGQTASAP